MPAYFVDFARLGNDSLCLFLFGLMWVLMLQYMKDSRDTKIWVFFGIVMGLSLLTKAFMIAIGLGLLSFMLLHVPEKNADKQNILRRAMPCATVAAIAILIGIWPYLPGAGARGSQEISAWLQGNSVLGGGIPWRLIMLNLRYMLTSTVYNFTDSDFTAAGQLSIVALLLFIVVIAAGVWARSLPRDPRREEWLPLYALAPLGAGLFIHGIFAAIAYRAAGVTPGYYVHVAAPALALILGTGLARWLKAGADRRVLAALFALAGIANIIIVLGRLATFTGCVWLSADDKLNSAWGQEACRPGTMYDRLALLAWPAAGLSCLALSLALLAAGATMLARQPVTKT